MGLQVLRVLPVLQGNRELKENQVIKEPPRMVARVQKVLPELPGLEESREQRGIKARSAGCVNEIRAALIRKGVSPEKIMTGAMDQKDSRREGRVAVLFTTA